MALACNARPLDAIGLAGADAGPGSDGACPPPAFTASASRGGLTPVLSRGMNDHAATVIFDGGQYRLWWCGLLTDAPGQHVLYAESRSLDGPWHAHASITPGSFDIALAPTRDASDVVNDSQDVCQPSVVRAGSVYYLYYHSVPMGDDSACDAPDAGTYVPHQFASIRVATSADGLAWSVQNAHDAIVSPAHADCAHRGSFGAGRPSVVFLNGLFYMTYDDSTGNADPAGAEGQYVIRSPYPLFQSGVDELTAAGFAPRTPANHTDHVFMSARSVDWQYADAAGLFVVVSPAGGLDANGTSLNLAIDLFGPDLGATVSHFVVDAPTYDAPAVASSPEHHAIGGATCADIPVDMFLAVAQPEAGALAFAHAGLDLTAASGCACSGPDL
jgi:hypothetical protein